MHCLSLSRFQRESQEYKYRLPPLHIFVLFFFVRVKAETNHQRIGKPKNVFLIYVHKLASENVSDTGIGN
jgi:hypothetical protein